MSFPRTIDAADCYTIQTLTSAMGLIHTIDGFGTPCLSQPSTFKHRYDWIRHEGPLHYQPYRWLCCSEAAASVPLPACYICGEKGISTQHIAQQHFASCLAKEGLGRDFWRKDHLADHIKRVHCVKAQVPDSLLAAWKMENVAMPKEYLRCGFCGYLAEDWEERVEHVFGHFKKGTFKEHWFPGVSQR
jgi:hypothetical protein